VELFDMLYIQKLLMKTSYTLTQLHLAISGNFFQYSCVVFFIYYDLPSRRFCCKI